MTHPAWRVWDAVTPEVDVDVAGLYGASFVPALSMPPVSALIAEGSPVLVYAPKRLTRDASDEDRTSHDMAHKETR